MLDQIQRRRRAVDTHHLTGTEGRRLHTPAADIAVQIQYPLAGDIGRQARPVHAVVIEPAGLLAAVHRGFEAHTVLFDRDPLGHLPVYHLDIAGQILRLAGTTVVAQQDALGSEHLHQRLDDLSAHPLHAGGGDLHYQIVGETIHHQSGQQVRIPVNQTVEGLVEQPLTQAQGDLDAVHQQGLVQTMPGLTAVQPGADQVVGTYRGQTQQLARGIEHLHLVAGCQGGQRRLRGIHLVAEYPQVAGAQATVTVGFEAQGGQIHADLSGWQA